MRILKFGGTSMGDAQTWRRVIDIITRYETPFVIVSATAHTTRKLLKAAQTAPDNLEEANAIAIGIKERHIQLVNSFLKNFPDQDNIRGECQTWVDQQMDDLHSHLAAINKNQEVSKQQKDAVTSIGERLSSYLFARCASATGLAAQWVNATDIVRTDSNFGQANPNINYINSQSGTLKEIIAKGQIPIMGGYYGMDANGNTTTLGFEGSDYSASIVGAALDADAIEIWTDVSGIYTCDPRYISDAKPIPQLSFQEATELAFFGAKVLHPSTTKPAAQKEIPVLVKNIFNPDETGTCISTETTTDGPVKAITYKEHCTIITVTSTQTVMGYEFLADVFDVLRWHQLPVDVVTTTEASVSIAIENGNQLDEAVTQLKTHGTVDQRPTQGIISLVGCNNSDRQLIMNLLSQIDDVPLNMISYSKSKGNLNIVVNTKDTLPAVKRIHKDLFS